MATDSWSVWPNIHNIGGFNNIVADRLSRLTSTSVDKYEHIKMKYQCHAKKVFATIGVENNNGSFQLYPLNVKIEQQK